MEKFKDLIDITGLFILTVVVVCLVFASSIIAMVIQAFKIVAFNLFNFKNLIKEFKNLFTHIILGADQFGASVIYGKRGVDWYVSSIAYYDAHYTKKNIQLMHFINWLFDDNLHCEKSFKEEYKVLKRFPCQND